MMRLYHGTTDEAYRIIIENGFCHNKVVWTCSDPNVLYFYRHDLVAEKYGLNEQEAIEKCFELALAAASCTAAITNSTSSNLFVYEFLIDDDHMDIVAPDTSTVNAGDYCVCIDTELLNVLPHNVYSAQDHYAPSLILYYLSGILQRDYLPKLNLTDLEELVIENVIKPGLELFQSTMFDFLSQPKVVMLHENICAAHARLKVRPANELDQLNQSLKSYPSSLCQY